MTAIEAIPRQVPDAHQRAGFPASRKQKPVEAELALPLPPLPTPPQPPERTRPAKIGDIILYTLLTLRVPPEHLGDKNRHPRVVAARRVITRLARRHTLLSYPEIARAIDRPSHSTVITADQRLGELMHKPVNFELPGITTWADLLAAIERRIP